jgi:hypothetical protein
MAARRRLLPPQDVDLRGEGVDPPLAARAWPASRLADGDGAAAVSATSTDLSGSWRPEM